MKFFICFCIFICYFSGLPAISSAYQINGGEQIRKISWKLVNIKGDVFLYKEKNKWKDFHMYKAVALIDAQKDVIISILLDANHFKDWMPWCYLSEIKSEKKIEAEGAKEDIKDYVLHMAWDVFWPIKNRDFVVQTKANVNYKDKLFFVEFSTIDRPDIPSPKRAIRVNSLYGRFELDQQYVDRDQSRFTFYLVYDPAGHVPINFTNKYTGLLTRSVVAGLIEAVAKHKQPIKKNQ